MEKEPSNIVDMRLSKVESRIEQPDYISREEYEKEKNASGDILLKVAEIKIKSTLESFTTHEMTMVIAAIMNKCGFDVSMTEGIFGSKKLNLFLKKGIMLPELMDSLDKSLTYEYIHSDDIDPLDDAEDINNEEDH